MSSVLVVASRVWQTTATTGTGDISFDASVPTGYRSFVSAIGNGNFCPYVIDDGQGNWEIGLGTISSGTPDSMARTTVKSNSLGTTAKINFGSGTKTVKCVPTGSSYAYLNSAASSGNLLVANASGGFDPKTLTQVLASGATVGALLDISGASAGQIKFPATQNASANANTLDDYEEGTWTPTDASGASLSFSSVTGCTYTKTGRQVFMTGQFTYPSTANGSSASVGGAPFANAGGSVIGTYICSSPSLGMTFMNNTVTTTTFTVSGTGANATNANFSTGVLRFTQTYNAAT